MASIRLLILVFLGLLLPSFWTLGDICIQYSTVTAKCDWIPLPIWTISSTVEVFLEKKKNFQKNLESFEYMKNKITSVFCSCDNTGIHSLMHRICPHPTRTLWHCWNDTTLGAESFFTDRFLRCKEDQLAELLIWPSPAPVLRHCWNYSNAKQSPHTIATSHWCIKGIHGDQYQSRYINQMIGVRQIRVPDQFVYHVHPGEVS
jgi:hypothetical protein